MPNYPKRVVEGKSAPLTNELWLDTNTNPPVLKTNINGEWVAVNTGVPSSDDDDDPVPAPVSAGDVFLEMFLPTKLVGYIDDSDQEWPYEYDSSSNAWVLKSDLIPGAEIKDYILAKWNESPNEWGGRSFTFDLACEYDAEFENHGSSWRQLEVYIDKNGEISTSGISSYSYNAKVSKDGVFYLVGFNPGD